MDQQVLKDLVTTSVANGYDYDKVLAAFPELEGVDMGVIQDYVTTAVNNKFDYDKVNKAFPEFFPEYAPKKEEIKEDQTQSDATVTEDGTASTSDDGSLDLPISQDKSEAYKKAQEIKEKNTETFSAEDLYDMEEDDVVSYFGGLNIPGLEIEKASVIGNQYNVKIAGQEPFSISASYAFGIPGDKEEAVSGFQKILDHQKSVKEKDISYAQDFSPRQTSDNVTTSNGWSGGNGYTAEHLEYLNNTYGKFGYKIEQTEEASGFWSLTQDDAQYRIIKDGQEVAAGAAFDVQDFMLGAIESSENSSEIKQELKSSRSAAAAIAKQKIKEEATSQLNELTDSDFLMMSINDKSLAGALTKNISFESEQDKETYTKTIAGLLRNPEYRARLQNGDIESVMSDINSSIERSALDSRFKNVSGLLAENVRSFIQEDEEGSSAYKNLLMQNKEKRFQEINQKVGEKIIEESGLGRIIQASSKDTENDLNEKEKNNKQKTTVLKNSVDTFIKDYKENGDKLAKQAKNEGVSNVEYNENTKTYTVTASDPEVKKKYELLFNRHASDLASFQKDFKETSSLLEQEINSIAKQKQDASNIANIASKNYNFQDIISAEIDASFTNTIMGIPALFGSKNAINQIDAVNDYVAKNFETAQQYGEVESISDALKFGTRTISQQSAPIVIAIATAGAGSSVGLSSSAISSITAGTFGVSAAGGKRVELEGQIEMAANAIIDLENLEKAYKEGGIEEDQYLAAKYELERQIEENDMTAGQKWGSIISSGVIEGAITKWIGTIPNASKAWKAFANPVDDVMLAASRSWYQNAAHKFGQFAYRTGGEVIEESSILLGTQATDALFLGREFSFDQLDETIVTSIITSGSMNGPSLAYSGIMQHMANPEMRQAFKDQKQTLVKLKRTLQDPNLSEDARSAIHSEITAINNSFSKLTDEMETNAILLGPKNLGQVVSISNQQNELFQRAGIDPSLPSDVKEVKLNEYKNSLNDKQRKTFESELDALNQRKNKLMKGVDYTNGAVRMYGAYGQVIADKLAEKNKDFKKLDAKEQAILVHQEFKKQEMNRMIGNAKSDPSVQAYVENQIYGESFDKLKKEGKRKRRSPLEKKMYREIGAMINSRVADGLIVNREENISAQGLLEDKRLQDLQLLNAKDDKDLINKATMAYADVLEQQIDKINRSPLSKEEKQEAIEKATAANHFNRDQIISEINNGETNGAIVGGQYITTNVQAAQAQIAEGNILAGTVLSHEISHALDARAMSTPEITEYGKRLQNWMIDNDQATHIEAMNRMASTGFIDQSGKFVPYYDRTKDISEQSDLFWDEYGKSIQDIYRRPSNVAKRRKLRNTTSGTARMLQRFGGDFKIDTDKKAAMYLSSFLDGFEKGKVGALQKRKIDYKNTDKGRQELAASTRKSANSPILHSKANALGKKVNAIYENKDNNPDYAFDIAKEYEGMVRNFLSRMENEGKWDLGEGQVRQDNINDFIMNATISERGILGMVMGKGFKENEMVDVKDPKTGETVQEPNTISRYLNGTFPQRLTEFVSGTTIDPGVFKANLENMGELVSTEKADKLTDEIVQEANNQFDTPLLEQFNFTQEMLNDFRSAVARTVGVKLPALDAKQGKNQSISPLIRELKKQFGIKNGPLHKIVKQLMGKTKAEVEAFLTDPGNKQAILDAMTTTWLASNLPMAVEKKVRGVGYTTDHVGRKKGTKPGDIEAWNASEDGPYKGMTDGKQKIRRNPNATKDVSNAEMLSKFAKGETMTAMNRAGLEKLQLAMAQELGLEMFKADLLNDGELANVFKGRQELFDRVLADNYVEEFVRQTERGITKRSANPNVGRAYGQEILAAYINNKGDKNAFENEIMKRGIPLSVVEAFNFEALDDLMSDSMPAGYKNPLNQYIQGSNVSANVKGIVEEANNMGAFNQTDTKAGDAARVKMATEVGKLVDALPLAVFLSPVVNDSFFGFMGSSRAFDVSKLDTKPYSNEAKKAMRNLKNKIDKKKSEALSKRDEILSDFTSTYGFNPENTRLFNAGAGLMGKVEKQILHSNETEAEKRRLHEEKFGKEHRAANVANPRMLELVNNTFLDLASNDRGAAVGWVYWNSMNTNNTSGPRSLSTWNLTQYETGPQGLYKGVDTKNGELRFFKTKAEADKAANVVDVEVNKDHPNYKQAEAEAQKKALKLVEQGALDFENIDSEVQLIMFGGTGQAVRMSGKKGDVKRVDWGTGLLRAKGEHVTASATTSAEIVIAGLKALDNGNFDQAKSDIKKLTQEFDQALGSKVLSDIQDEALGTTSRLGYARVVSVLDANPAIHTDINTFKTLDGETATDLAVNQFADREAIDAVNKIRQALSPLTEQEIKDVKTMDKTVQMARTMRSANPRGMSAFDFDETLIDEGENFITATKDGETKKISSGQWPLQGPKLAADGWSFDFSDFVNVRGGVEGPLFTKFKERLAKFGPENMFILTARPAEAATAIHGWLKSKGVEIPLENITGLGNSTGEAKALWMLRKFEQGYNDMYFVDDALPNVAAVKNVLDQLDIKSDVQIAKRSANPKQDLNIMLERSKGVDRDEVFNRVKARNKGRGNRVRQLFIPPSADDFQGLMYYNMGKGEQGNQDADFFKRMFYNPYNRADRELDMYKQTVKENIKAINKQFPDVRKKLKKDFAGTGYTAEQAMRIYLYDKNGHSVPGISEAEQKKVAAAVAKDYKLVSYATLMEGALKTDGYIEPKQGWNAGSFNSDFADAASLKRTEYLQEWNENIDATFDEEMLNKLEAIHGSGYRSALEDSIARMKSGTNRPTIKDKRVNGFLDWLNGSVGAIMFFNGRSAVLQTLSTVNFINFEDNNIFAAAKAFANQKQYWQDFSMLFNSPMLKQRRGGIQSDLNASELARLAEQGGVKAVIGRLLEFGFTPTQIADSFAISAGGATFYRNRVKKYLKLGFDQQTAETRAFEDFQETAEATQQSSRPDKISQEQASVLGRLILAFQNTPMQYNRIIKKSALDLINGRGDTKANISRILYYGAIQNIIFSALQNALFAVIGDDDEDEEFLDTKVERIANGTLDSLLRGSGIYGAVLSTVKNTIMRFMSEREKGTRADNGRVLIEALNVSPPLGSKARKMYSAMTTDKWNKDIYDKIPLYNVDNPIWDAAGNTVEAVTNVPAGRIQRKISNLKAASDNENATWQRLALFLGWDKWSLGIERPEEVEEAKKEAKEEKKEEKKQERKVREAEIKEEKEKEYLEDQQKEKEENKKPRCAAATRSGSRCKGTPVDGTYCTIHTKVEKRSDGKEVQCKKVKSDGKRCKMKTSSKSGLCYYHD